MSISVQKGYIIESLRLRYSQVSNWFRYQPRHRNKFLVYRFNTVPGHDGTGSDAERAERLSTGEAFALSKWAVQSDIQVLARRSGQEAGIPNVEKGSGPASRGQYERTLRGPREFRIRMHRLNRFVSIRSENPLEIIYLPFRRSIEGVARGSTSISINGYWNDSLNTFEIVFVCKVSTLNR